MSVSWYVARDADGSVSRVVRIHEDADRTWGEYLRDGRWIEDAVVLDVRTDDAWGSLVDPEEGEAVASEVTAPS